MRFVIVGKPRTKNSGQIITRGRIRAIPSKPYRTWLKMALQQFPIVNAAARANGHKLPIRERVRVKALFYRDRDVGDLDRYLVGFGDFLQRAGVIENDRQIASWDGSSLEKDAASPRVECELSLLKEEE